MQLRIDSTKQSQVCVSLAHGSQALVIVAAYNEKRVDCGVSESVGSGIECSSHFEPDPHFSRATTTTTASTHPRRLNRDDRQSNYEDVCFIEEAPWKEAIKVIVANLSWPIPALLLARGNHWYLNLHFRWRQSSNG